MIHPLYINGRFLSYSILLLLPLLLAFRMEAQAPDPFPLPLIYEPTLRLYIATDGMDGAAGDSLQPLATFHGALDRLVALTIGQQGEVYAEVVLLPGVYPFALVQPPARYQVEDRRLHVSVRGVGEVILDGSGFSLSGGSGMVHLLGSHIAVRNLRIPYSPSNGVRFGFDWNGTLINPGDILIEDLEVRQTAGHGIIVGTGPLSSANPLALTPMAERFAIRRCHVHQSVNYNQPATQWGSAIKFHNVRYGLVEQCLVHDNGGEGINVDLGEAILIRDNVTRDNLANIYLDKAMDCTIERNLVYYEDRVMTGILLGLEPFSAFVTDHFMRNIHIRNNVILNAAAGINVWQGTISGLQRGYFTGIDIRHNTIIGKRVGNGAPIGFSYETFLGQPVPNVQFADLTVQGNLVAAHPDSLNNGRLMSASLNPQPGLKAAYNLWSKHPVVGHDPGTDRIEPSLPLALGPDQVPSLRPHADSLPSLVLAVPNDLALAEDFLHLPRFADGTNAGAMERDTSGEASSQVPDITTGQPDLIVSPNPFRGGCQVSGGSLSEQPEFVVVQDPLGRATPFTFRWQSGRMDLDLAAATSGMYFLILRWGLKRQVLPLYVL
jgi:hypothetical protein